MAAIILTIAVNEQAVEKGSKTSELHELKFLRCLAAPKNCSSCNSSPTFADFPVPNALTRPHLLFPNLIKLLYTDS
jgi:hypothetical protein